MNTSTFYPYVVNASNYPSPSLVSSGSGSVAHPELASTVYQNVPSFLLVYASTSGGGSSLEFRVGNYSAPLAEQIVARSASTNLPIYWSTPITITTFSGPIDSDAIAAPPTGVPLVVSVSSGGSTNLYDSWNFGQTWSSVGWVAGESSSLALSPSASLPTALVVAGSSSSVTALTVDLSTGRTTTDTWTGGVNATAASVAPAGGSETEGVAAISTAGSVAFYVSRDLGHSFQAESLGQAYASSTSSVLNSIGTTRLTSPGGVAGQITATVDGSEVFLAYTTSLGGQDVLVTQVSPDGGLSWDRAQMTSLPLGSIMNPQVSASTSGYVYVTALDNAIGTWEVDQSIFAADGRVISSPSAIPGSGASAAGLPEAPAVSVDAFQRPLYVWTSQPSSGGSLTLQATGAFLNPATASSVVQTAYDALVSQDLKPASGVQAPIGQGYAPLGGPLSTQTSRFNSNIRALETTIGTSSQPPVTDCSLSAMQNETAASVYSPATPDPLLPDSSPTIGCANLTPALHPTSTVAAATGPFAAASYMAVLSDWLFEAEAVPVDYGSDPLALNIPSPAVVHSQAWAMAENHVVSTPGIDAPDGSAVYVFVGFANANIGGGTVASLSDNLGNAYTWVATATGADHNEQLWVASSVRGGSALSITATFTTGTWTYGGAIDAIDLVGAAPQSMDVVSTNSGSGTTASVSLTTTHSMDTLLFGADGRGVTYPLQPSQGATTIDSASGTPGPLQDGLGFATTQVLQPAAGPVTLGVTVGTSVSWAAIGVGVMAQMAPPPPLSVAASTYAAGTGPSVSAAVTAAPVGSALCVFAGYINSQAGGGTVGSVSDSQGDTFRHVTTISDNLSRNQDLWTADAIRGSADGTTVTVTFSSSNTEGGTIEVIDVVGQTSASLDSFGVSSSQNSQAAAVRVITSHAGDLLLAGLAGAMRLNPATSTSGATVLGGGNATTGPWTDGMGFNAFYTPTSDPTRVWVDFQLAQSSPWTAIAAAIVPAGTGTLDGAVTSSPLPTTATLPTPGTVLPQHSSTVHGQTATADLSPAVLNPTTGSLTGISVSFPTAIPTSSYHIVFCGNDGHPEYFIWSNSSETVGYSWSVTVDGHSHSYSSSVSPMGAWNLPGQVYLTNLTQNAGIVWSTGSFQATYDNFYQYPTACGSESTKNTGFSFDGSIPGYAGTLNTSLAIVHGNPFIAVGGQPNTGTEYVSVHWNNSMPSQAIASLTGQKNQLNMNWSTPENFQFGAAPVNYTYTASLSASSQVGGWNATQAPSVNANELTSSPALSASYSCTFQLVPNFIDVTDLSVSNNSTSRAFVSWFSNYLGPSWVSYEEYGTGVWLRESASELPVSGGQYQYFASLEGLSPFAFYVVTAVTTGTDEGCLTYEGTASTAFLTSNGFPLFEQDRPYDSLSGAGGGAVIWFQTPAGALAFTSGYLSYVNNTRSPQTVTIPIGSLGGLEGEGSTYGINLTLFPANQSFTAQMQLNFTITFTNPVDFQTYNWSFSAVSQPLTFVYLRDTSGDGLTDIEKANGWMVTYAALDGTILNQVVTANPDLYATNGLVGDYVEKEFGLDPYTVDSAGSHMLDTWNLTFNLGLVSQNPKLPATSLFQYWYENSTNPFGAGVPSKANQNLSNLTPTSSAGRFSGDGSPWASTVLWSSGALATFENLSGVRAAQNANGWLRAVTGTWKGVRTLTVWGKLSWGANPLATSTSGTGVPDGAQVDPLGGADLQVTITGWKDNAKAQGNGVAAYIYANSSATAYSPAQIDYGGYSVQVWAASNNSADFPSSSSPKTFVVTFPVTSSEQFAYLNLSLVQNESTSKSPDTVYAIASTTHYKVDLTNYHSQSRTYPSGGGTPSISFTYQVVPVFAKAPTWVLAPPNNTTLSPLPMGLSRYTAEQDFDLLVLNDTAPKGSIPTTISVGNILGPQLNWKYSVTLLPGLNNLLVPRSMFLASPLGQTLINATGSAGIPSRHQDSGLTFNPYNWLPRVLNTSGNYLNTSFISVFSSTTQTGSSGAFGGVASNPGLEAGYQSRQVQAVFWINVSNAGYNSNLSTGATELTDLLGGFLLNSAGKLTGNLLNETTELPTLGFSSNVLTALANSPYRNDGAYGTPVSTSQPPSPPQPWWDVVASDIWNGVSGVVTVLVKVVSVAWNGVVAAAVYLADAAAALSSKLGITSLVSQTVSALRIVGDAMWTALQDLLNYVIELITSAFTAVINPAIRALNEALSAWNSYFAAGSSGAVWAYLGQQGSGTLPGNVTADFENYFLPIVVAAGLITIALAVVLGIALPLSIGIGVLVTLAVPILVAALSAPADPSSPTNGQNSKLMSVVDGQSKLGTSVITQSCEAAYKAVEPTNTTVAVQPVGHPYPSVSWDWYAFLGAGLGLAAAFMGLITGAITEGKVTSVAGYVGAFLGFAAMILSVIALIEFAELPSSYNGTNGAPFQTLQTTDVWLAEVSLWGLSLSVFGAVVDTNPNARAMAGFGAVFSGIGLMESLADLSYIHSQVG